MNETRSAAPYAVSWSGGKDSALALWRATAARGRPAALLTMTIEDGTRSRSHGLRPDVLEAQAHALGLPILMRATSWRDYERHFVAALESLRAAYDIEAAAFGDIDLEDHRAWCRRVCDSLAMDCVHPLWGEPRAALVDELLAAGFEARIVAVQDGRLDPALLGRTLDRATLADIEAAGADLCGENGEYHTVIVDGPAFRAPLRLVGGVRVLRDGYWFLDLQVAAA